MLAKCGARHNFVTYLSSLWSGCSSPLRCLFGSLPAQWRRSLPSVALMSSRCCFVSRLRVDCARPSSTVLRAAIRSSHRRRLTDSLGGSPLCACGSVPPQWPSALCVPRPLQSVASLASGTVFVPSRVSLASHFSWVPPFAPVAVCQRHPSDPQPRVCLWPQRAILLSPLWP